MSRKDEYYNRSKVEGYRARSAFKLKQMDEAGDLLHEGDTVVDLGAAPGGWLQVAAEAVGEDGVVVGVDFQRIDPLEDYAATVETLKGDMTEDRTRDRVVETVREARSTDEETPEGPGGPDEGDDGPGANRGGPADVVLSDMAPNMSGEYNLDQARSVHLARQAFETAEELLATGGNLVVKVFQGQDVDALEDDMAETFESVRRMSPDAVRDSASEIYLVGKGYLTAPVAVGDEVTVDVVDEGAEGDGIAKVDGFTVFVPGASEGETVDVRIEGVKAKFAFAERR